MSRNRTALIEAIEARRLSRFRWRRGRDCVSFAAACVQAQTGRDVLADLGSWTNLREVKAMLEAQGGLEAALDARFDRVPPALAQRGDIAGLPDARFGIRLMVIEGDMLVGPATRGLERLPRSEMTIAWSIEPREGANE